MITLRALAIVGALGLLVGCAEAPSTTTQLLTTLERSERSYLGLSRLEFASVLERRMDAVHRLFLDLDERNLLDQAQVESFRDRHGEISQALVELRLEAQDWESRRNAVMEDARRLEEEVVAIATQAAS